MSGGNGTHEICPLTAMQAASGAPLAGAENLLGELGQMTAAAVSLIALPPAVTSLSEAECDVASSNLVNLVTSMPRELTPSEASHLLNDSIDFEGGDEARAELPLRKDNDDCSLKKPAKWADQPGVDTRHLGPEVNIDSVQAQIQEMRLANTDGASASSQQYTPLLPVPWPISSFGMLRAEIERLDALVSSRYPSGTKGLPSPTEMLYYVHKDACRAVKREMRRQDKEQSVHGWDLFLEGKQPEEFVAIQMLHWDTDSDIIKAVSLCRQYSDKILVLRAAS